MYSEPRGKSICLGAPCAQIFEHLTNLQTMFHWPRPAKTPLSPQGTICLLGSFQALIYHHLVMAARFFETLKNKVRIAALRLLSGPFGISWLSDFVLPSSDSVPSLCPLHIQGSDITLGSQQSMCLVFAQPVFYADPFLFCKNLGILYIQLLNLRQLLHAQTHQRSP